MSKSSSQKIPGWFWLIIGAALGALVMYLMGLSRLDFSPPFNTSSQTEATEQSPAKLTERSQAREPRTFSFYKALPEHEVPVTATPATKKAVPAQWYYIIQVASFQSAKDAEDLRAKLILENFDAYTESSRSKSGTVWHRILVGPFANRSQMEGARSHLQAMRFNPMPIKRKITQ